MWVLGWGVAADGEDEAHGRRSASAAVAAAESCYRRSGCGVKMSEGIGRWIYRAGSSCQLRGLQAFTSERYPP